MDQVIDAVKTPKTIQDLKFRMLFRSKGEGHFLYRVTAIDDSPGGGEVGLTRDHDKAKIIVTGNRFCEMIRTGALTFISEE